MQAVIWKGDVAWEQNSGPREAFRPFHLDPSWRTSTSGVPFMFSSLFALLFGYE